MVDAGYPFEFSLPLPDQEVAFEFRLEGMKPDGALQRSEAVALKCIGSDSIGQGVRFGCASPSL
jgi:hypothetical protein